jgi:hypothetical protein
MMTAANPAFPGMANSKESAILSATAEASNGEMMHLNNLILLGRVNV